MKINLLLHATIKLEVSRSVRDVTNKYHPRSMKTKLTLIGQIHKTLLSSIFSSFWGLNLQLHFIVNEQILKVNYRS